jgi:hypothetical protein
VTQRELHFGNDSAGAILARAGMARAADNAEACTPGWQQRALEFIRSYPSTEFMAEDVRAFAYERGLPRPPHDRAWGAVFIAAKRMGLIVFSRFALVSNAKAHRTPASVWNKVT